MFSHEALFLTLTEKITSLQATIEDQFVAQRTELDNLRQRLHDAHQEQRRATDAILRWASEENGRLMVDTVRRQKERLRALKKQRTTVGMSMRASDGERDIESNEREVGSRPASQAEEREIPPPARITPTQPLSVTPTPMSVNRKVQSSLRKRKAVDVDVDIVPTTQTPPRTRPCRTQNLPPRPSPSQKAGAHKPTVPGLDDNSSLISNWSLGENSIALPTSVPFLPAFPGSEIPPPFGSILGSTLPSDAASIALRSIKEHIYSLPAISSRMMPGPSDLALFSESLIRTHIGGNIGHQCVVNINPEQQASQVAPFLCQRYISLYSDYHPLVPQFPGKHGAMLDYAGLEMTQVDQKLKYPLFIRVDTNPALSSSNGDSAYIWSYCGDYVVNTHVTVCAAVWKTFPATVQEHWVIALKEREWGQEYLKNRGLVGSISEAAGLTVEDIMEAFAMDEGGGSPDGKGQDEGKGLRLIWSVLKCVGFDRDLYDGLLAEKQKLSSACAQGKGKSTTKAASTSISARAGACGAGGKPPIMHKYFNGTRRLAATRAASLIRQELRDKYDEEDGYFTTLI